VYFVYRTKDKRPSLMSGKLPINTFISLEEQHVDCSGGISLRMLFKETVPRVEKCIIIASVADNTNKI
jgi:hypothetical protein